MRLLALGDICGETGMEVLRRHLRSFVKLRGVDIVVCNGENADVLGLRNRQAEELWGLGVDVVTLGNHAWGRQRVVKYLKDRPQALRPLNFSPHVPGASYCLLERQGLVVAVFCMVGRCFMEHNYDNPFTTADALLSRLKADLIVADFHAEATSEKAAMAYHLDGRVSALFGTHTHVQTSDERIFPSGLGFITDIGMTGAYDSVLGVQAQLSLVRYLGGIPQRYEAPTSGMAVVEGALFTIDPQTRTCADIERIREFCEIESSQK